METNWVKYGWTYVIRKIDLLIYKKFIEYIFCNMETVYISIKHGAQHPLLSMKNLLNIVEDDDMVSGNMKHIYLLSCIILLRRYIITLKFT